MVPSPELSPPGTSTYASDRLNVGDGTWDSQRNTFLLPNLMGLNFEMMQYNGKFSTVVGSAYVAWLLTSLRNGKQVSKHGGLSPFNSSTRRSGSNDLFGDRTYCDTDGAILYTQPLLGTSSTYMDADYDALPYDCHIRALVVCGWAKKKPY